MLNRALRLIRIFHDLRQTELAEKLQISKSHLSEIESGKKIPTIILLMRYSEVLDLPLSSIMFFAENMDSNTSIESARSFVSSKIINLLNFIAERSGDIHAREE